MMLISLLYFWISYTKTVFILSMYFVGYFAETSLMLKGLSILDSIVFAISSIIFSLDFPPPLEVLDWIASTVESIYLVWACELVISALSCSPKTSGVGFRGKSLM